MRELKGAARGVKRKQGYGAEDPEVGRTRKRLEGMNRAIDADAQMEDAGTDNREVTEANRMCASSA